MSSQLNVELAQRVLKHIEKHPDALDMDLWFEPDDWNPSEKKKPWKCGTTACIAGWAMHFSGKVKFDEDGMPEYYGGYDELGRRLLGLADDEADAIFKADESDAVTMLRDLIDKAG